MILARLRSRYLPLLFALLAVFGSPSRAQKEEVAPPRRFEVPAGDANLTLRVFAQQSGQQLIYLVDVVRGQRTRAVYGTFPPMQVLERMLQGTDLIVRRDPATGATTVVRNAEVPPVNDNIAARAQPRIVREDEVIEMTAFTVSTRPEDRYRASDAISAVRVRASLLDTPSSISVITRSVIDDLSPTRLFDVTRYIAGVEDGRGIQFSDRQIIRGFESNGRTVDNFLQIGADNYDEAVIERIEISKGPNAILAPAGVPGGSINVITKSPSFSPHRSITAVIGLFDAQKVTLDLTGPLPGHEALAYRFVAAGQDTRRYWASDARLRNTLIAPMLTWRVSDRSQLTFKLIAADHWVFREPAYIVAPAVTPHTDPPTLAPGFSTKGRNGIQPWSHVGTRTTDAYLLFTSDLSENVSLRIAANGRHYYEDSTQEFLQTPTLTDRYHPETGRFTQDTVWTVDPVTRAYSSTHSPFFDPTAIPVRGDTQDTTHTFATFQSDLAIRQRLGSVHSQSVLGWAYSSSDQESRAWRGNLPPINLLKPGPVVHPIWDTDPWYDNDIKIRNWQLYLNQRLGFFDNRVQLTGGLTRYDVYNWSTNTVLSPEPRILDDARTLHLGSILVKPRDHVSLYYVYSSNSTPAIVNEAPIWRDGQQHEIGLKTEWFDRRLAFNIAWFDITQTNVAVPNPERQTDINAPEQLISNLGDHGMEFELAGGLTRNLSILASHTELRLRDRLGRPVRGVADRNSSLLLNYRFREGFLAPLSISLGITRAGRRPGDTTSVDFTPLGVPTKQSFTIQPYTLVNLAASTYWGRTTFRLNIDNLFDDAGYLQQAGGRVSGTGLSTAPGINVKFTTSIRF